MEINRSSGLKFYSIGIVVKDKEFGQDVIEVDPIEDMSLDDGKIVDDDRKMKVSLPDHKGRSKAANVVGGSVIKAKWLPLANSNRDTAPDVYKNETVLLYRFADEQEYYWGTILREPRLRKLERVRYIYSNVSDPSPEERYDKNKSYWVEYSTKDKHVHLHTSANDGEFTTYDAFIKTGEGRARIQDGNGNFIEIRSFANEIEIHALKRIIISAPEILHQCDITHITGVLEVDRLIHGHEQIIDDLGNTNHHSH